MSQNKLFSIIVVTLNCEKKVKNTFESIKNQTAFNLCELIVIDGGSVDRTVDEIKKFTPDILISEADFGIFDAMNKGVLHATGQFCIFINAGDEFWDSKTLSKTSLLIDSEDCDLIYGDYCFDYGNSCVITKKVDPDKSFFVNPFHHQATFYRKKLLLEYKFDLNYKYASDCHQYLRLKYHGIKILRADSIISKVEAGGVSDSNRIYVYCEWFRMSNYKIRYIFLIIYELNRLLFIRFFPTKKNKIITMKNKLILNLRNFLSI